MKASLYIFLYSIIACIALYVTENIYHPVYLLQMSQKIISFVLIPVFLGYFFRTAVGRFGHIGKLSVYYGVGFGVFSTGVIAVAYYFLQDVIDWTAIRTSANARGVNETTFLLAFGYIMFGNSLVEEFFFRGVVFRSLTEYSMTFAYVASALMFSFYHITIFGTWFSGYVLWLALFGLFVGGLFFAWLYRKTGGIWGAWIFHIFADLAILIIGYIKLFQ